MSLAEWQAALDRERAAGLRRGSTLPKQAPTMQKVTTPLSQEPHYTRAKQSNRGGLTADQDSACFDELVYSQSAGGVFATFAKDGSQYFYPMSRSDAKEWFDDDLGRFFNAVIR
ncbi:MAG: hypothetical protein ABSA90_06905 [Xanthobacteraceae bacterium]